MSLPLHHFDTLATLRFLIAYLGDEPDRRERLDALEPDVRPRAIAAALLPMIAGYYDPDEKLLATLRRREYEIMLGDPDDDE